MQVQCAGLQNHDHPLMASTNKPPMVQTNGPSPVTPNGHAMPPTTPPNTALLNPAASTSAAAGERNRDASGLTSSSNARRAAREPVPVSKRTIAAYMAEHPNASVKSAIQRTYPPPNPLKRLANRFKVKHSVIQGMTDTEMAYWQSQGAMLRRRAGWKLPGEDADGVEISELFWKMYLSLMPTIVRDPLAGITSPDLLGSTATMPLSVVSLIPDIIRHFRDVIVRAKTEVFIATNYWQPSDSVDMVSSALRDLSANVIKSGRPKVVVKLIYDRGSIAQVLNSHVPVGEADQVALKLPPAEEIPGLHLEVINFHRMLLGTFHCKFIIVDRKVVLLSSNNIQDRPNLELMTHLEGPIVDAFYDIALHSWYNKLEPPLPFLSTPYEPPRDEEGNVQYLFNHANPYLRDIETLKAARAARLLLRRQTQDTDAERARMMDEGFHPTRDRLVEAVRQVIENQRANLAHTQENITNRSANAMKELRGFGERIGFSGSRPPSRRASASDLTKLRAHGDYDDETAAITAANVHLTRPAESEATASPTLHEFPTKSQTEPYPPHHRLGDGEEDGNTTANTSRRQSFQTAREDAESEATHATHHTEPPATLNVAVTGRLTDGPMVESPVIAASNPPRVSFDAAFDTVMENDEYHADGERPQHPDSPFRSPEDTPFHGDKRRHSSLRRPDLSVRVNEATTAAAAPPPTAGRGSIRSFRWAEDLPSGAQSPLYQPRVSVDEEIPPGGGTKRMFKLSRRFNAGALSEAWATVEDSDDLDNFRPHVIHQPHDPFPIAMVCRRPHGFPGHHDIRNPQNAAWLAGCRYAQRKVFIQTPTLNARPIVRAIKQACRRGVEVVLFLDLGFNDKGESIPFQGGTNEQVVDRLYKKLGKEGKSQHLKVYWYTGKDQIRPLNAVKKQRNCHIKLAVYDDEVAVLGNGNQDSQSWFHSSEVNVMINNKQVIAELMETLMANQNTLQYGGVGADGVWRDDEGKTLEDYGATGGGGFLSGLDAFMTFAKSAAK